MTFGKTFSPVAVIIFGIVISIVFFLRTSCEANELVLDPACGNVPVINTMPTELPAQNRIGCDKDDQKTVFESVISYFLEKLESSPPVK